MIVDNIVIRGKEDRMGIDVDRFLKLIFERLWLFFFDSVLFFL